MTPAVVTGPLSAVQENLLPSSPRDCSPGFQLLVNGTPTFYINGARHDDSFDMETLLAAVDRAAFRSALTAHFRASE